MDRFRPGETLSASKLNQNSVAIQPQYLAGPGAFSKEGGRILASAPDVAGVESFWVTLDAEQAYTAPADPARTLYKYSWTEVVFDPANGYWARNGSVAGHHSIDPVMMPDPTHKMDGFEVDRGTAKPEIFGKYIDPKNVYPVTREPFAGNLVFGSSGGSGKLEARSNSIIMLLGPYEQYKDCEGIQGKAADPPRKPDGSLCGHFYAWAEYAVCGYRMKKIRDMRDFPYWASPLNNPEGGSFGVRRLYNAYFGNPSAGGGCAGVRFDCGCNVASLDCICPDWMSPVRCLQIKFKTIPRPCPVEQGNCGYANCDAVFRQMDLDQMWDKEFSVELCSSIACYFFGEINGWNIDLQFLPKYMDPSECFWGPDWLEPCEPCLGFGSFTWSISVGVKQADCGVGGHISGTIDDVQMKELVEKCTPIKLSGKKCNGCRIDGDLATAISFVVDGRVELTCCDPKNTGKCNNQTIRISGGSPEATAIEEPTCVFKKEPVLDEHGFQRTRPVGGCCGSLVTKKVKLYRCELFGDRAFAEDGCEKRCTGFKPREPEPM